MLRGPHRQMNSSLEAARPALLWGRVTSWQRWLSCRCPPMPPPSSVPGENLQLLETEGP